jgi:GNAT superfamily N-acetyltransferase
MCITSFHKRHKRYAEQMKKTDSEQALSEWLQISGLGRATLTKTQWLPLEDGLWGLGDSVQKRHFFTLLTDPQLVKKLTHPQPVHVFVPMQTDVARLEQQFAQFGFVTSTRNFVISHALEPLSVVAPQWACRQVQDAVVMQQINRLGKKSLLDSSDLQSGGIHLFAAFDAGQPVAWVCGCTVGQRMTWNDDLFTLPQYRGRGIAVELMNAMHGFERESGVVQSFSFSTETLFAYHQRYGYKKLAWKLRFSPPQNLMQRAWRKIIDR